MIIFAINNGGIVYAYNEKKERIIDEKGTLYNYTDSTVAIERNNSYYIYDDKGCLRGTYPKDFVDTSNIVGEFL